MQYTPASIEPSEQVIIVAIAGIIDKHDRSLNLLLINEFIANTKNMPNINSNIT